MGGGIDCKEHEATFCSEENIFILIMMVVTTVYTFAKTHLTTFSIGTFHFM